MKTNEPQNINPTARFLGIGLLALLWIGLVAYIFKASGFNLKNILLAAFSGFIIFYPLWNKYIQPILDNKK